eukprot:3230182-Prymnesium_polylepis.1
MRAPESRAPTTLDRQSAALSALPSEPSYSDPEQPPTIWSGKVFHSADVVSSPPLYAKDAAAEKSFSP